MNDNDEERLKLWNRFNSLEVRYSFLKSVVQNEIPQEYRDGSIDSFKEGLLEFTSDLDMLAKDTIKFLKS